MPAGRPHKCPYCGSTDTASKGARKTKSMGLRRIRRCKACGRKFTPKSQPLLQAETPDASQPEAAQPIQMETPEVIQGESPEPVEAGRPGTAEPESPRPVDEPESPNDEHHSPGL